MCKARERCSVNAKLCTWIADFSARVKQQQLALAYGDLSGDDPRDLQVEFDRLKLAIGLARELAREPEARAERLAQPEFERAWQAVMSRGGNG